LAAAVVTPAVGLDDEAVVGEEEVDLLGLQPAVDERLGQSVALAEREEAFLDSLFVMVVPASCVRSARRSVAAPRCPLRAWASASRAG
jgi:hypothetical protein